MLNEWLKMQYTASLAKQAEAETMELLSQLPFDEVRKLADGTPIAEVWPHLEKKAYYDCSAPTKSGSEGPVGWLDQFKDTPLLQQAIALENEELQAEMTDLQRRQEQRKQTAGMDSLWDAKDQIRMKKRLLELEKVKQEAGAAAADTPAQGAGAPGPVPAEGVQDDSQGLGGGVAKSASAKKIAFAEEMGRALARHNFEKAAHVELLTMYGSQAGEVLAKVALDFGALGGLATKMAPMAQKALGFAKANPTLTGAALGAGAGALAGGQGHRLSGALGGAALGGGIGHVAGGGGGVLGQKARGAVSSGLDKLRGMMPGSGAATGAVPQALPGG
jgi:hypothetical protein